MQPFGLLTRWFFDWQRGALKCRVRTYAVCCGAAVGNGAILRTRVTARTAATCPAGQVTTRVRTYPDTIAGSPDGAGLF